MSSYPTSPPTRNYDQLVRVYDLLARCWSGGAILTARLWCAERVSAGERVLVVGPGTGIDAASMAKRGANLLLIDHSLRMLQKSANRCPSHTSETPQQIHGDFRTQKDLEIQDSVVVPFFLNVFSSEEALQVMHQLRTLIDQHGRILISDFSPPPKNWISRLAMEVWHAIPMSFFYLFTGNAWHRVHDIPQLAAQSGLEIIARKRFSLLKWGPCWIEALELRQSSSPCTESKDTYSPQYSQQSNFPAG